MAGDTKDLAPTCPECRVDPCFCNTCTECGEDPCACCESLCLVECVGACGVF